MVVVGLILAAAAALIHVFIFVMESVTWTSERTRATFGTTAEQAEATKELAFNQGFYNLFLAIAVGVGILCHLVDRPAIGTTLVLAGTGMMAAAGIVLLLSSPSKASAALKQLVPPLLAVIALVIGLVTS